ncbi:MAG: hypothetical protein Q7R87_03225 [Nanoarchaeota archaeon]|nr:hypothetical protein [Nanoarchaeota archaeon]
MKFNFKKIASVLAGTVLMSSTLAFAAAANYPAPFVKTGNADVYVVYGSAPGAEFDLVAVADITTNLQAGLAKQTATSGTSGASTSATGENYPLFTSSSELFLNSTLDSVVKTLTPTELPTILKDDTFSGDVSATYEQRIITGSNPIISFAKQPTDDDDAQYGLALSTTVGTGYVYNATVTFASNVNFTHADSKGQELNIFGQKFTIGSATTSTKLVLFKSSEKIFLDSESNPSQAVTIAGKEYTVSMVAATDTSATIKVTNAEGVSEQKEVNEAASKKINGVEVAINTADESTALNKLTAEVIVGADRITLTDGNAVKIGTDEDTLDGTNVEFFAANGSRIAAGSGQLGAVGKMLFQAAAKDSTHDAMVPGDSFIDPIFGSFKVDFSGINIATDSTSREDIVVKNSGNDKMSIKFTEYSGAEKTVSFVYNKTDADGLGMQLADADGDSIIVGENNLVNKSYYVVLANKDRGGLYEVTGLTNSSSATASDDELTLRNVFTDASTTAKATTEGAGTITVEGLSFSYSYYGAQTLSDVARQVRFNYPEFGGNDKIYYPTIKTSKGALVAFYQPALINLTSEGLVGANIQLPNGNGYEAVAVAAAGDSTVTFDSSTAINLNNTGLVNGSATATVGQLVYNFTSTLPGTVGNFSFQRTSGSGIAGNNGSAGAGVFTTGGQNVTALYLTSPEGGNIVRPAAVIFEEKDDGSAYHALIVTLDAGYDGDSAGIGVNDIIRTYSKDTDGGKGGNEVQLISNSDLYKDTDLWGSISTLNKADSDQTIGTISYPDNQVQAYAYVAADDAAITTDSGSTGSGSVKELGSVLVKDSEVASLPSKNLVVVGGSCINAESARLLGVSPATCGADFTAKAGVGAGQFLIQTFAKGTDKVATLVAGYNAADTQNAAKVLTTKADLDTSAGKKYVSTSATAVELKTTATTV